MTLIALFLVLNCKHDASPWAISHRRAQEIWKHHEGALKRAAKGTMQSGDDFEAACLFFSRTVGILPNSDGTFDGLVPNENTIADLQRVRDWYARNHDRLYWDQKKGRVAVAPPLDAVGAIWWKHESRIVDLLGGEDGDERKIRDAQTFFLRLTGIYVPVSKHPAFGLRSTIETEDALQDLRNWYYVHGDQLYIDRASGELHISSGITKKGL